MLGDAHMGETLQKWIEEWKSGRVTELPNWIPVNEAEEWNEFQRLHPELTSHDAGNLEQYHKLKGHPKRKPSRLPSRLPSRKSATVYKALNSIRSASIRNGDIKFTALFHHININVLTHAFFELRRDASSGCDKVTWKEYAENLEENIKNLWRRIINWLYYPQPVRRTYIPKASGGLRPLGICAIEDKIIQYALKMILENIYEPKFRGVSYGFRPGTRAHDALDAVYMAITTKNVNYILDADIVGCFDNINKSILHEILKDRIGDKKVLKLVERMTNAGVLDKGDLIIQDNGVIQGSIMSPLLANIFLDYVLDGFVLWWRATFAKGEVYFVRYADDYIIGFEHKEDAENLLKVLKDRLLCAGLRLNDKKTRLIKFGKNARNSKGEGQNPSTETFDFLGFTHKCGITRNTRRFKLVRNCVSKRVRKKIKEIKEKLKKIIYRPQKEIINWINSVLNGYYGYFAVHDNLQPLTSFRNAIMRLIYNGFNRLSQRCKWTWEKFNKYIAPQIAFPHVKHPYPCERMAERQKTLKTLRHSVQETKLSH